MSSPIGSYARKALARRRLAISQSINGVLEKLEERVLLSTNDAALIAALKGALGTDNSGLSARLDRLNGTAMIGKALPMIGTALSGLYSPKAQLDSILGTRAGGVVATVDELRNALEGAQVLGDGLTVTSLTDNADHVEMAVRFQKTVQVSAPLTSFGSATNLAAVGANLGNATVNVNLDFTLNIGAYLDGSNGVFYVNAANDSLKATATVTAANLAATARLGFVDISIANGAATLGADFSLDLNDPNSTPN